MNSGSLCRRLVIAVSIRPGKMVLTWILSAAIGINSGELMLGAIGGEERLDCNWWAIRSTSPHEWKA
jgi:hypothetical protein